MIKKNKPLELKKHVATIHSSNKISLLQRKIANALLFNAYDDLLTKDEHEIHIKSLCNLIGYDSNDHKTIKKSLVNLLSTVIEWNLVDGDKLDSNGIWNASSIISDASIDGAICTYSYSNKMKKLLHRPERYGRLNMLIQAKFQSSYGLALYENCVRFQEIGQTPWVEFDNFRKLMGIDDGKYKIFRDFKARVLDKAVEEVNKYSSLHIEPQLHKQSRKVIAIQFLIKTSKQARASNDIQDSQAMTLSELLKTKFGLSKRQLEDVFAKYEESYILEKIALIEASPSYKTGKIKNLAKYLLCAINEDYQAAKPSSKDNKPKRVSLSERDRKLLDKQIMNYFNRQPEAEKKAILKEFEPSLKGLYEGIYRRDGFNNFQTQMQFCLFVKEKMPELLDKVLLETA